MEVIDFLRIFDRWGNMVHEETNLVPQIGGAGSWDGKKDNQKLEAGVYVYVLQVRFLGDPVPIIQKGDVTLIH